MARIRTIKPEFFTSEDIVLMTPLARLFYVSLWCESDREGRLEWKPGTFKMRYLPGDDCSIDDLAAELTSRSLIVLYSVNDKTYAYIPTFTEHQVINNREQESRIPAFEPENLSRVITPLSRVKAEGREGRERKEWKGMEGDSPAQAPNAPPDDSLTDPADEPKKRRFSDEDMTASRWMHDVVLKVNASAKTPNFESWAGEVRLMREIDARTHKEICELFLFAKHDNFWAANIQSPGKLRAKWDTLVEQRNRPGRTGSVQGAKFQVAGQDHSSTRAAMEASMKHHGTVILDGDDISFDD